MSNEFGDALHYARRRKKMTQRELAKQLQVSYTYISKMESGTTPAPAEALILHMAQILENTELILLAEKIPSKLGSMLVGNPKLCELLYELSYRRFSDEQYQFLIAFVRNNNSA